jgi:hypothetical protein
MLWQRSSCVLFLSFFFFFLFFLVELCVDTGIRSGSYPPQKDSNFNFNTECPNAGPSYLSSKEYMCARKCDVLANVRCWALHSSAFIDI